MKNFFITITFGLVLRFMSCTFAENLPVSQDLFVSNAQIKKFYDSLPNSKEIYRNKQRPILIQGAMNVETDVLVHALDNPIAYRWKNYLFVAGNYKGYPVVISKTEQGLANAAATTVLAIDKFNPIAVINQGTAGAHTPELELNDIVIGERILEYSAFKTHSLPAGKGIDITKQILIGSHVYDPVDDDFKRVVELYSDEKLLNIAKRVSSNNSKYRVKIGTIGTGDTWIDQVDHINWLHETYGTDCEEMESSSVAQICQSFGIPFLGIRVISDNTLTGKTFDYQTGKTSQNFTLLVAEEYIRELMKK